MSLRDSRDNSTLALRLWDDAVDMADDCAEANAKQPAPVVLDTTKSPIRGG